MNYAGIITAAGLSSRMGAFKPLLEINGLPMICHTVMSMKNAGLYPICVVTGYRGDEIKNALADYDVIFAENENYASSDMLSSVKLGLVNVKNSDGFFLLPGDMPLISPKTFKAVREKDGSFVIPVLNGKNAHPPLIKKQCFDTVLSFSGDGGLPKALSSFEKTYVEITDTGAGADADYMHEFEAVAKAGRKTLGLSDGLCTELFDKAGTLPHIRAHGKAVGILAEKMAKKLISKGYPLNLLLCRSAGTLHDICRLEKLHAEAGGDFLKKLGYDAVLNIVKHHMSSAQLKLQLDECTLVFLADKLMRETELVTPKQRYAPAFEKFPEGTEIGDKIRKDCIFAEKLLEKYAEITGDKI